MKQVAMKTRYRWLFAATLITAAVASEPKGAQLVSSVLKRLHQFEPTREERRFDLIGWAKDVRDAERLAREHSRPLFVFTHDGNIATGRC